MSANMFFTGDLRTRTIDEAHHTLECAESILATARQALDRQQAKLSGLIMDVERFRAELAWAKSLPPMKPIDPQYMVGVPNRMWGSTAMPERLVVERLTNNSNPPVDPAADAQAPATRGYEFL